MTKLVIFDMAGTIIDHGCFAPISAFVRAFGSMGIEILVAEARGPMGLHKRDHIQTLLEKLGAHTPDKAEAAVEKS